MCDFEKQGSHLFITIKTGFCVEFVRKNIYCGFWNTVVYVHDIIVRHNGPQKHFRCTKSSGNLEILTSIYDKGITLMEFSMLGVKMRPYLRDCMSFGRRAVKI